MERSASKHKAYHMPGIISGHRKGVALFNWQLALQGGNILEGKYAA
jgi:hypothetical protein